MALEISVRIKELIFSEEIIKECIEDFWQNENIEIENIGNDISKVDDMYDTEGFIIYLIKKKEYPYNIYDSEIYKGEYQYSQVLSFDINKNEDLNKIYNTIMKFIIYLYGKYQMQMLVTTDFSEEICYFEKEEIISINSKITYIDKKLFGKYNILSK